MPGCLLGNKTSRRLSTCWDPECRGGGVADTMVQLVSGKCPSRATSLCQPHPPPPHTHKSTQGGYRPCNRMGISTSTSPFLKVTFETAAAFLVSSTLHGDVDTLTSPASRIVLGEPVAMGTGSLDLIQRLDVA